MISRAERPVLLAGGGVIGSSAADELNILAEKNTIPVASTLAGLGAFPCDGPLNLGMLGMHGTYEANMAMHETDVLIAIGARFDDRITGLIDAFSPNSVKAHIDIDPSSINKVIKADIPIVGDVAHCVEELVSFIRAFGITDLVSMAVPPGLGPEQMSAWQVQVGVPVQSVFWSEVPVIFPLHL